ncbi:MAG: hypothetical protein PF694_09685 [Bacteroidetes bacterium]|nr:hypothetical protein [Bacteroidota bacterium]
MQRIKIFESIYFPKVCMEQKKMAAGAVYTVARHLFQLPAAVGSSATPKDADTSSCCRPEYFRSTEAVALRTTGFFGRPGVLQKLCQKKTVTSIALDDWIGGRNGCIAVTCSNSLHILL